MKTNQIVAIIILLIVFSGASFFVGTKFQQKKAFSGFKQQISNNNKPSNRNVGGGFRQTVGEIISSDEKSITVKLPDGSSKIILISDTTIINQATPVSKTDLKTGLQISVSGDQSTDGAIVGKIININPVTTTITPTTKK